eukprot:1687533-Rhodomonas_salina.2
MAAFSPEGAAYRLQKEQQKTNSAVTREGPASPTCSAAAPPPGSSTRRLSTGPVAAYTGSVPDM